MGYVLTAAILVVVIVAVAGSMHVRHETRIVHRRPRAVVRTAPAEGDICLCGGTVGRTAGRSGTRLGCTDCNRMWLKGGRQVVRRRARR